MCLCVGEGIRVCVCVDGAIVGCGCIEEDKLGSLCCFGRLFRTALEWNIACGV